jgi:hypothetical protein
VAEVETLLAKPSAEAECRRVVERLALALAGAVLQRRGLSAAADAFITRRLGGASLTFGAGVGAIDENALIERVALRA